MHVSGFRKVDHFDQGLISVLNHCNCKIQAMGTYGTNYSYFQFRIIVLLQFEKKYIFMNERLKKVLKTLL